MINPFNTEPRMPWYGYLIANIVVWILVSLVFAGTKLSWFSSVKNTIDRPGVMSLLIFIPIVFLFASLYDFFFDNYNGIDVMDDEEEEQEEKSEDTKLIPAAGDSGENRK